MPVAKEFQPSLDILSLINDKLESMPDSKFLLIPLDNN